MGSSFHRTARRRVPSSPSSRGLSLCPSSIVPRLLQRAEIVIVIVIAGVRPSLLHVCGLIRSGVRARGLARRGVRDSARLCPPADSSAPSVPPPLRLPVASPALSACCWQRRSCTSSKQRGSSAAYTTVVTDCCLPHLWSAVSSSCQSCLSLSSMQLSSVLL